VQLNDVGGFKGCLVPQRFLRFISGSVPQNHNPLHRQTITFQQKAIWLT
jgi:hypothetical protein